MSRDDDYGPRRPRHFDPGGISPEQVRRGIWLALIGVIVLSVLVLGKTMFYRVEASDEGVVLRFGKEIATVTPGLHVKLPWPIDQVYKVPVQRIQSLEFGFETTVPRPRGQRLRCGGPLTIQSRDSRVRPVLAVHRLAPP